MILVMGDNLSEEVMVGMVGVGNDLLAVAIDKQIGGLERRLAEKDLVAQDAVVEV